MRTRNEFRHSSGQSLREAIEEIDPTFVAWVISFFLVGMYWVWHRDLFVNIRHVNRDVSSPMPRTK